MATATDGHTGPDSPPIGKESFRPAPGGRAAAAPVGLTLAAAAPAVVVRLTGVELAPPAQAIVFGAAVVATAFLLAWAAEAAQLDISGNLAIAVLAIIAVLPEYAVDLYFADSGGHDPAQAQFAAANMTGSNRLLIGVGWPAIVFVALAAYRRRRSDTPSDSRTASAVHLDSSRRVEVAFLAASSAFAFVIVAGGALAWWHSIVLLGLFGLYLWRISRQPRSEPQLTGVPAALATLPPTPRRTAVASLFVIAAVIVVGVAQPFADSLVANGEQLGINKFLLVQWVAPLASESPELIVAGLFAWRLRAGDALGTLLSSKVNQWTLLIGTLPLAYLLGGGHGGLPLDSRQTEEFLLTATQALLALAVVLDLEVRRREAIALMALFLLQLPFPQTDVRLGFSAVYTILALAILIKRRRHIPAVVAAALRSDDATSDSFDHYAPTDRRELEVSDRRRRSNPLAQSQPAKQPVGEADRSKI